jgi:hypothetical protein
METFIQAETQEKIKDGKKMGKSLRDEKKIKVEVL